MTEKNSSAPSVSMSNTKKELIDAYEQMRTHLNATAKDLLNAQKARDQAEKEAAVVAAKKAVEADPVKRIHDLRSSLGKELLSLAEKFENEVETYKKVDEAVQLKQVELQTLYQIEGAASDLAVLIEAQNKRKNDFETEMDTVTQCFEQNRKEQLGLWEKEKKDAVARRAAEKEQLEKERKREEEEYGYLLSREREMKQNELQDRLAAMEKEISAKRGVFDLETGKRTEQLDARERDVVEREKRADALQRQVDGFQAELQSALDEAMERVAKQLHAEFDAKRALGKATSDGEKHVLENKVGHLEHLVESQARQIEQMETKQESAYQKVQDIASRAVDSARREVVAYPMPKQENGK